MLKSAVFHIEGTQRINCGHAVLNEPRIGMGIDSQCRQACHNLRNGLCADTVNTTEGAVCFLHHRQSFQCFVYCRPYLCICLVVGSQCLQCHAGDVSIGGAAAECPTAVGKLSIQDDLEQSFTGHIAAFRNRIISGIKSDQRPNGAVNTLFLDISHISQTGEQIMSAHIGNILADCRQCQDHTGILSRLCAVQAPTFINILLYKLHCIFVVSLGNLAAGTDQVNHHPLTADGSGNRSSQFFQIITGGLVDIFDTNQVF